MVIVNWNSRDDVLAGVRSLRDQTDPDLEIVVVDNGSQDCSAAALRAEFPDVRVLEAGENLGFAEGCNRGIDATRSEWVFLFNNDAVAEPACVAELRKAAAGAPDDVGMIQPLIVFSSKPTHVNSSGVLLYTTGQARDRHFAEAVEAVQGAGDPLCSTAGASLYRRAMLEKAKLESGYFDRGFFMYFEDVDLGWRCRLMGYRTLFVPAARVRHRFQGSSQRRGKTFVGTQCRVNRVAMLIHNGSLGLILRSLPLTAWDMGTVIREEGLRPPIRLIRRLPGLLRDRSRIGRLARVNRAGLERTWLALPPARSPDPALPDRHD